MRFLCCYSEDTNLTTNIPVPALFEMIQSTHAYCEDLKKKNKATEYGFYAHDHGGFVVFNCSSVEEFTALAEQSPIRPFCKVTTQCLQENSEFPKTLATVRNTAVGNWEKMQAALGATRR